MISHGAQEDCEAGLMYSHSQTFGCSAVKTCVGALVHMKKALLGHLTSPLFRPREQKQRIITYFYVYLLIYYYLVCISTLLKGCS